MIGGDYDYIRKNSNTYMPSYTDEVVNSPDLRCNKGASAGDGTQTYDVKAGDKVGFKLAYNEFIEHPGPGFVYMSLAPSGDVSSYEGDGDWFKVWESGMNGPAADENSWGELLVTSSQASFTNYWHRHLAGRPHRVHHPRRDPRRRVLGRSSLDA